MRLRIGVEVKGWGWGSVRRTGAVASGARKVGLIEWYSLVRVRLGLGVSSHLG